MSDCISNGCEFGLHTQRKKVEKKKTRNKKQSRNCRYILKAGLPVLENLALH